MAKAEFSKKKNLFTSKLDVNLRKKLMKCYIWTIALYGAQTWTLRATDQKHLESFEMWCWRRMEKISWTDHVRNEEALFRVNEQRNILHEISKRKANWIGHILRRNCLIQRVIEGKVKGGIGMAGKRGRRRRNLLDGLEDSRGSCELKEEALDRTVWRDCFGRGFGPLVWQITVDDDDDSLFLFMAFSAYFVVGVEDYLNFNAVHPFVSQKYITTNDYSTQLHLILQFIKPTNAHIISHKTLLKHFETLRHVSILSDHHQGA